MNLLIDVPFLNSVEELKEYLMPLYVMENYWKSKEVYKDFQIRMRNIVRGAFRKKALRTYKIKFKFYKDDNDVYEMELRHFLYNIYIWYPLCELYGVKVADESFILKPEDTPRVNQFIGEKILKVLESYSVKRSAINHYIADVTDSLASISLDFSMIMGLTFSEYDFIQMYKNPEIAKLMEISFDPSEQPVDIEARMNQAEDRLVHLIKSDPNNPLGVILRAKTGMKTKQLAEFMLSINLRPSLTGEVIAYPIENSTLVGGLDRPSYMYIDALGARKPLLANNKEMGPVGYFGKTLNLAARSLEVSKEVVDCHTQHYVTYEVRSEKHLAKFQGKYYFDEEMDEIRPVNTKDKSLIGKKIKVRSPITCCCAKNQVCATCVGQTINLNWDIAAGFATFMSEEYSKDIEQNVLSTKHLLTTNSERIEFNDKFYDYFSLIGEEIRFLDGLKDVKDLAIYINPEEIKKVEEFDPNSTYNTYIESGRFYIVNVKTGESQEVQVKKGKQIFICTDTSNIMDSNDGFIPFKDIDEEQSIFEVSISNNELVKPFYDLINLLDSESRTDMDEVTIDNMAQRFLDIIIEAKIDISVVAGEMILNRLCRKPDDVRERPNFGRKKLPDYRFFRLSKIVEENGSPVLGLVFEQLLRQITRLDMDERHDPSYMDPFFKELVSTEPFMKQRRSLYGENAIYPE